MASRRLVFHRVTGRVGSEPRYKSKKMVPGLGDAPRSVTPWTPGQWAALSRTSSDDVRDAQVLWRSNSKQRWHNLLDAMPIASNAASEMLLTPNVALGSQFADYPPPDSSEHWITTDNGAHVLVREGETVGDALERHGIAKYTPLPEKHFNDLTGSLDKTLKDYGKKLSGDWLGKLTTKETAAFKWYTEEPLSGKGGYIGLNKALREGQDLPPDSQENHAYMQRAFKHAVITEPTTVYRGLKDFDTSKWKEGQLVELKGYSSTSLNRRVAADFLDHPDKDTFLEIRLPAGANAAYINSISGHKHEHEVLLPHNSRFHVVGVKEYDRYGKSVRMVVLEYRPTHSYAYSESFLFAGDVGSGHWVTMDNGEHLLIHDGETLQQALNNPKRPSAKDPGKWTNLPGSAYKDMSKTSGYDLGTYGASSFAGWRDNLTKTQKAALSWYTGVASGDTGYKALNTALRDGHQLSTYQANKAAALSNALSKAEMPDNHVVFRGLSVASDVIGEKFAPGNVVQLKGFSSTSLSLERAEGFARKQGAMLEIRLPKGANAAYLDGLSKIPGEHEVLIPHGATFKVVAVGEHTIGKSYVKYTIPKYTLEYQMPGSKQHSELFWFADDIDPGRWVTMDNGEHLLIHDGETLQQALNNPKRPSAEYPGKWANLPASAYNDMSKADDAAMTAYGTHSFAGWRDSLTKDQKDAVAWYTGSASGDTTGGGGYKAFNRALRDNRQLSTYQADRFDALSSALSKAEMPDNHVVFRGLSDVSDDISGRFVLGNVVKLKGFSSTSMNHEIADLFVHPEGAMLEIRLPKGANAAYLDGLSKIPIEHEVLVPHGATLKVVAVGEHTITKSHSEYKVPKYTLEYQMTGSKQHSEPLVFADDLGDGRWVTTDDGVHVFVKQGETIHDSFNRIQGYGGKSDYKNLINKYGGMDVEGIRKIESSKHVERWKSKLNADEAHAIKSYTGTDYIELNYALRNGEPLNDDLKSMHDGLLSAMDKTSIPSNLTLYRGMRDASQLENKFVAGKTLELKGFLSTSLQQSTAANFTGSDKEHVLFAIRAPKGAKGMVLDGQSDMPVEHEVVLPHGARFKVLGVETQHVKFFGDRRVVHLQLLLPKPSVSKSAG